MLLSCNDGKEMFKNRDAGEKWLFCQSKPIALLPLSLTSPLLKVSNNAELRCLEAHPLKF